MISGEVEADIVRKHLVERWPVGTIAKQLHIHHTVVRRVLSRTGYLPVASKRPSKADPFMAFILGTLEKYPQIPASRLYDMVTSRGYVGGPDHFRTVISKIRPKPPAEAYLRLRTLAGEEAQVDWAFFGKVQIGRALRMLVAFVMVLSWCRVPFLRFGYDMRMGSFLDGHERAFNFFGGVPRRCLYDNLKSAVLSRAGDAIQFNPELIAFAQHYRYEPRPVAVRRGNEKGRVERSIQYVRSSFFPARTWVDLDDLNRQALAWCLGTASARLCPEDRSMTVAQAYDLEKPRLLALPADHYPVEEVVPVQAGKTPYVRFDLNDYSIPYDRVRRSLQVRASSDQVRVLDGVECIATHPRSFDRDVTVEDPCHISALVEMKSAAREGRATDRLVAAVPTCASLLEAIGDAGGNLGGATVSLLRQLEAFGAAALEAAIGEAIARDTPHLHAVRLILDRNRAASGRAPPIPIVLPADVKHRDGPIRPHKLATYDDEVRK